jgi:hypothetical protein
MFTLCPRTEFHMPNRNDSLAASMTSTAEGNIRIIAMLLF